MLAVLAIGGNALLRKGEKLSVETQQKNLRIVARRIKYIAQRHRVVITHGNGPQVGNIMIQVEAALGKAYPVPLHVAVAESEGEIGYLLEQAIYNELRRPMASILTQTVVSRKDPAFRNPTKPIGPYYGRKEAALLKRKGYAMIKINGGWRRVVASPKPVRILESATIKKLAFTGIITIAAGGGGIPVYGKKRFHGIDAVIDKDLASACLAKSIDADMLVILTDVPYAYLNYRTPQQKPIRKMTVREARKYLKEGQFPPGSMGPKIEAAVEFLENGGKKAIITSPGNIINAAKGGRGTIIMSSG